MACTYICVNCNSMSGDHKRCPDCQFPRYPNEKEIRAMLHGTWPELITERCGGKFVQTERLVPVVMRVDKA